MPVSSEFIARHYAVALADAVPAADREGTSAQLYEISSAVSASTELQTVLHSPGVTASHKARVIEWLIAQKGSSHVLRNFLLVMAGRRRLALLPYIAREFEQVILERAGVLPVNITVARELTEAQRARLAQEIGSATGKSVRISQTVDPSVIGGVVARIDSVVFDGSVRGQLEAIGRRLSSE